MKPVKDLEISGEKILSDLSKSVSDGLERGLDKAASAMLDALQAASPYSGDSPEGEAYRDKWEAKRQYRSVRYIHNTKTVQGTGGEKIPLSSILENGTETMPAQPHIQKTYDAIEDELAEIILGEINLDL